jgi:hypothetical protein
VCRDRTLPEDACIVQPVDDALSGSAQGILLIGGILSHVNVKSYAQARGSI